MPDFYIFKKKYQKRTITLIYHYKTKTWYFIRNELIEIIFNPKLPSSYWAHLKKKYLKANINIDNYTKIMKITSKDNKIHPQKVISINNVIKIIKIFNPKDKLNLIKFINYISKKELIILENELELNKVITNYINLGYTKKQIIEIVLKKLN